MKIIPSEVKTAKLHGYMLSAIAPRPIAFASTINKNGEPNLSPYSFFNAFGSNPSTLIFSPARRVRDNTIKHTLENVYEVPEVVINTVNYSMVQQMSLSSTEYAKGINEFEKSGLTQIKSELVNPFRVKESPVQFECKVREVIETGKEGGAGNLIVCEILLMHISDDILDDNDRIDQNKIDLVSRLGGNWYCRASGNALFEVEKPISSTGIGVDQIPESIRNSNILTGNNLGQLGNIEHLPNNNELSDFQNEDKISNLISNFGKPIPDEQLHILAKYFLEQNNKEDAWKTLLINSIF